MKKQSVVPLALLSAAFLSFCLASCAGAPEVKSGKPVILVVSFGTSYQDNREKTIGAIEQAIAAAYPDYEIRRAFTSQIIINAVAKREGTEIDTVDKALERLVQDKVKELIVQPTHIMNGIEYDEMMGAIKPYESQFTRIRYGRPLLSSEQDFAEVTSTLIEHTKPYRENNSAVVFMGHGTEHDANAVYTRLDGFLKAQGNEGYFVGTVEAEPTLEDILAGLRLLDLQQVVLLPFMIVAGDHAHNDMAGDDEDSWKSILAGEGYSPTPILKGLGEYPEIRQIFIRHIAEALGS